MTPLERPEQFSDQAFLTDEQAAEYERQTIERRNDDDVSHSVHAKYWLDWGDQLYADKRTSLIVDPPNGRVPPLTQAGRRRADARRAVRSARGRADSWEDRTLWERCLTRGLPTVMLPAPYNGYVRERLQAIFPDGVCDWSQPGVSQSGLRGTWLTFGPGE